MDMKHLFVVYFRRQNEFIISNYNWGIRTNFHLKKTLANVLSEDDYFKDYLENYEIALSKWSEIVGDDHIIVNPYEGEVKKNIIPSFLQSVGIEHTDNMVMPENRVNTSICSTILKLKRRANCSLNEFLHIDANLLTVLSERLTTLKKNENRSTKNTVPLSPHNQRELIKKYESMNQRIAKKYLNRQELFLTPLPSDNIPFDETMELTTQELNDITTTLLLNNLEMSDKINRMQTQLHTIRSNISWLRFFNIKRIGRFLKRKLSSRNSISQHSK